MRSPTRFLAPSLIAAALAAAVGPPAAGETTSTAAKPRLDANPCLVPAEARKLRCPDLEMSPPFDLYLTGRRSGRLRLHAGNSIDSVGRGPAELRGRRTGRYTMRARQAIYRLDGTRRMVDTGARLGFKYIPGQGRYWKYQWAADFELWRLDRSGRRVRLARRGPKVSYCLRDLQHRNGHLPRSPRRVHYPACSQKPRARRATLGTSVGWSDVYPATYYEQYLNVTGLRGCFAYVHLADPKNGIYESNEDNNEGETIVRLPWRGRARRGCPRRSRSVAPDPGPPDGGVEADPR